MAVVAERQRLAQIVRQRLEPAEMPLPPLFIQLESDPLGPALIEEA
jgi:hypothetical protein